MPPFLPSWPQQSMPMNQFWMPGNMGFGNTVMGGTQFPMQFSKATDLIPKNPNYSEEDNMLAINAAENMGESWIEALKDEFTKAYFIDLLKFLREEMKNHTICPPLHQVFSWTHHCPPDKIKVVIIGQDPYPQPGRAHGLSFSVQNGRPKYSLKNIFKELETDESLEDFEIPSHGNLTGWAEQGVLLLNTVLTVRAGVRNSHKNKGWEEFTDAVIKYLNENFTGIVFMLWGEPATKKGSIINQYHKVLKTSHPSPFSAKLGFFGCKHFSYANEYLISNGKDPIHWDWL